MLKKYKNIVSFFLLIVFILPSIIKLEHDHDHFKCNVKHEKHLHDFHESCAICNYEFSTFSIDFEQITLPVHTIIRGFFSVFNSEIPLLYPKYSFLLRAPPHEQSLCEAF